jgi:DNA-binding NtrC family response regulator
MDPEIEVGSLYNLPARLTLQFNKGQIKLDAQRMVLMHASAMASLRKELIDTMGIGRARGLLMRMGYASGQSDAALARALMPDASDEDLLLMGPRLHSLEGIADVQPVRMDIDIARGHYHGEFLWENSYEAVGHNNHFGLHHEPVCWTLIGYACGYTSAIMGRFILYREAECVGRGDRHCRIVGRPLEEWDAKAQEQEMRHFRPDQVADQLLQLQEEVAHLRYSLDDHTQLGDMVGTSPAFQETCQMLHKAAESHISVLLLGETGVGKEMCARALHEHSPRATSAFVAINCAAIPEELLESELFGVERGAFTGAQSSRPGRFERAHGGTLFLDEIGELSASAQAKLLRVLQEGELERIGDSRTRKVDVRVIAATNVDLGEAVEQGRFRADLYYRINVFPILVPPLRERREDIPLLVERFLEKYTARHGKRIPGLTNKALKALMDYDWPGNIRELENMIERGVILVVHQHPIDVQDLFPCVSIGKRARPELLHELCDGRDAGRGSGSLPEMVDHALDHQTSLEEMETLLLNRAVERANGNLSSAARMLGVTRPQLAYRLKKRDGR